jgi:phenylalanine-4-hydroxylase
MSTTDKSFVEIANRHGVNVEDVQPEPKEARLKRLEEILQRTDVPFPVDPQKAAAYFELASSNQPFGVGNLSDEDVDLSEYENSQTYENYTFEEHLSWACLIADQQKTKHKYACREYLAGEALFEIGDAVIPDYYILNARIYQQTGWQLATVSMIIPAELFFTCHSKRFFPVTTFMRPLEQDYLEEPDIGHDVAGHVATFTIPAVADVMRFHGEARNLIYDERDAKLENVTDAKERKQIEDWAEELLVYAGRIYWFTVEFGLVMQDGEVRDFGAGILSSPGETVYSVDSDESNRILIDPADDQDLLRLATTDYLISEFQKTYFVMNSFEKLGSLTPDRILWAAKKAMELPHYTWREVVPGDKVINVGSVVVSPNEKYYRLKAGLPMDECLTRTAIRNLRMYARGECSDESLKGTFKVSPPTVPDPLIEWFTVADVDGRFDKVDTEEV